MTPMFGLARQMRFLFELDKTTTAMMLSKEVSGVSKHHYIIHNSRAMQWILPDGSP
jgi:hypothetical protein